MEETQSIGDYDFPSLYNSCNSVSWPQDLHACPQSQVSVSLCIYAIFSCAIKTWITSLTYWCLMTRDQPPLIYNTRTHDVSCISPVISEISCVVHISIVKDMWHLLYVPLIHNSSLQWSVIHTLKIRYLYTLQTLKKVRKLSSLWVYFTLHIWCVLACCRTHAGNVTHVSVLAPYDIPICPVLRKCARHTKFAVYRKYTWNVTCPAFQYCHLCQKVLIQEICLKCHVSWLISA